MKWIQIKRNENGITDEAIEEIFRQAPVLASEVSMGVMIKGVIETCDCDVDKEYMKLYLEDNKCSHYSPIPKITPEYKFRRF